MSFKAIYFYFILVVLLASGCSIEDEPPRAEKGILDLRDWNFKNNEVLNLDGEWEFYWESFIQEKGQYRKYYTEVPSIWNGQEVGGKSLSGQGYASYRLQVKLPKSSQKLALKLLSFGSAYQLFVNGKKLNQNGVLGKAKQTTKPYSLPQVVRLPTESDTLDIVIQVANFHHKKGGFWNSVKIGTLKQIKQSRDRLVAVDLIMVGCLFILAIYHLTIYLARRQDLSALYFSMVSLLFSLRTLLTDERYLLHLFPDLSWHLTLRLDYLTVYLGFPLYAMFFQAIYRELFSSLALNFIKLLGIVLSLLVLVSPPIIFSQTLIYAQVFMVLAGIYFLYILFLDLRNKERRVISLVFIVGLMIFFLTAVNDILHHAHIINTFSLSSYGLLAFVLSQSVATSIRYAKSMTKVEELSATLEGRVMRRTEEISKKNELLEYQKSEIYKQTELLTKKNKNITASINYASRIQRAILGSEEAITSNFKDSFIFLKPKDIVSGDFYWYTEIRRSKTSRNTEERKTVFFKIIVAADCTGHGIPGAFMTVLGNVLLDEIINENRVTNPSRILSVLDRKLLMKLQKHKVNDGMDMTILVFDDESKKVMFAGANNPLLMVRNGELNKIEGSKFPVGSTQYKKKKFEMHSIEYQEGDKFYIFSDGYQDQFGGEQGRKYYKKHFRKLILDISEYDMKMQKEKLIDELEKWQGDYHQTDDILVIGIQP